MFFVLKILTIKIKHYEKENYYCSFVGTYADIFVCCMRKMLRQYFSNTEASDKANDTISIKKGNI